MPSILRTGSSQNVPLAGNSSPSAVDFVTRIVVVFRRMSEEFNHFLAAQKTVIAQVEDELSRGRKETHWMWFVFPQITGLGQSPLAQRFAIDSIAQSRRYLNHPVLGQRLLEHTRLVIDAPTTDITEIFDYP